MKYSNIALRIQTARFHNIYSREILHMENGDKQVIERNESFAILCREPSVLRVYWSVQDEADIPELYGAVRRSANGQPFVSEFIFQRQLPEILHVFRQSGMEDHCRMSFMVRKAGPLESYVDPMCIFAGPIDAQPIFQLLWDGFDPLISHLPTLEEIYSMILKNEIVVIRVEEEVAALAIFQKTGKTIYLYELISAPKFRGKGMAKKLLSSKLAYYGKQYAFSLWVNEKNTAAVSLYRKYGFFESGRKLIVMKGN